MIFISVIIAIVLVLGIQFLAPFLPFNSLLGGRIYQVLSVLLAIGISVVLNLPMLYMFKGNSAYGKGDVKKALESYRKALKTKKLSPDMEIYCGYMFLKEGDKKTCGEVFANVEKRKLTDRQKNSLDTNKALLLWKTGQVDKGVALLEEVWKREASVTVAGSLGALKLILAQETGDVRDALAFCEEANEKYSYEKTILANLGEAYYRVGNNEEALETFGELMDCGTLSPAPYYYYGLALLKNGEREEGCDMLRKALRQKFSALSTVSKKEIRAKLDEYTNDEE